MRIMKIEITFTSKMVINLHIDPTCNNNCSNHLTSYRMIDLNVLFVWLSLPHFFPQAVGRSPSFFKCAI